MRHRKFTFKINKTSEHRESMLANMVCSLFVEQRICTIVTRAKIAKRLAEKMITLGKDALTAAKPADALSARRRAIAELGQKDVVRTLFKDIAPRYADRKGGYTRIIHTGRRIGDGADMCFLELMPAGAEAAPAAEGVPAAEAKQEPAMA